MKNLLGLMVALLGVVIAVPTFAADSATFDGNSNTINAYGSGLDGSGSVGLYNAINGGVTGVVISGNWDAITGTLVYLDLALNSTGPYQDWSGENAQAFGKALGNLKTITLAIQDADEVEISPSHIDFLSYLLQYEMVVNKKMDIVVKAGKVAFGTETCAESNCAKTIPEAITTFNNSDEQHTFTIEADKITIPAGWTGGVAEFFGYVSSGDPETWTSIATVKSAEIRFGDAIIKADESGDFAPSTGATINLLSGSSEIATGLSFTLQQSGFFVLELSGVITTGSVGGMTGKLALSGFDRVKLENKLGTEYQDFVNQPFPLVDGLLNADYRITFTGAGEYAFEIQLMSVDGIALSEKKTFFVTIEDFEKAKIELIEIPTNLQVGQTGDIKVGLTASGVIDKVVTEIAISSADAKLYNSGYETIDLLSNSTIYTGDDSQAFTIDGIGGSGAFRVVFSTPGTYKYSIRLLDAATKNEVSEVVTGNFVVLVDDPARLALSGLNDEMTLSASSFVSDDFTVNISSGGQGGTGVVTKVIITTLSGDLSKVALRNKAFSDVPLLNSGIYLGTTGAGNTPDQSFSVIDTGAEYLVAFSFPGTYHYEIALVLSGDTSIYVSKILTGTIKVNPYKAPDNTNKNGGGGGGGGSISRDTCPNGDNSGSYYDGTCGTTSTSTGDNSTEATSTETEDDATKETILYGEMNTQSSPTSTDKCSIENSTYSDEENAAYLYACEKDITTMRSIQQTRMHDQLTRAEMAKIVSQYLITQMPERKPNLEKDCSAFNASIAKYQGTDLYDYMTLSCQYDVMGINTDYTALNDFMPDNYVSRAEFGTIFSRILRGKANEGTQQNWYQNHLIALKNAKIITDTDPTLTELRAWIFLQIYRATMLTFSETLTE